MLRQEEYICKNGVIQVHSFSDEGLYIIQNETGIKYAEAYDNEPSQFTYSETDEPIEETEE